MGLNSDCGRSRCSAALILAVAVVYFPRCAAAEGFQGDVELLKLAAVQNRVNVESLQTWRGALDVDEVRVESTGEEKRYQSSVDFAWDRSLDAKRWRWNCHRFVTVNAGVETPSEVGLMSGMLKDNAFYRLGPIPNSSKDRKVVVIHGENKFSFGPESVDFDPLYCFTSLGEPLYERFDGLYALAQAGGAKTWTASRQGDMISFVSDAVMPNGGKVMNRYDVDLSKGANVVAYSSSDPYGTLSYKYQFAKVSNSWVPVSYEYNHNSTERSTSYQRSAKWTENVVNEPTDAGLFSIESLGVGDGDRVKDSRSGTQYIIGGDAAAAKAARARSGDVQLRPLSWMMKANIVVAFVVLTYMFVTSLRRRRLQKAG